ncbi:pentatricopeptide repeat-containing protein At1g52640, mitochondrial [Apium graveolens]|uniref:pentatricopeptide repeat-containing protein At1g52640, mitochondrial n=1 Tax=Apium graveolens TaxID=4045 RepID=UPI003D7B6450
MKSTASLLLTTILKKHNQCSHFLHSLPSSIPCPNNNPPSPELVNNLSRILSDFRNPKHDIETALSPFSNIVSTNLVEQVLKRCKNLGYSAHRFFIWADQLPGFRHSELSYHILIEVLGCSKQFPLIWDFLIQIQESKKCEITRNFFWVIFRAYCKANLPDYAISAFDKMVDFGVPPGLDDLDQVLFWLCKRKHVRHAQQLFDRVKGEIRPSVKTYSILMRGWGRIGEGNESRKVFDEMSERGGCVADVVAYNCVLESLCKGGNVDEAYKLFGEIKSMGFKPDAFSYSIFIHATCEADDVQSAFRVLDRMRRYDLVPNVYTYNCIIKRLCKNSKVEEAYQLLDEMIERGAKPDTWSYNTILAFHCDHQEVNRALKLVSRMEADGCQPDRHTYNMLLKMLIKIGRFDRVTNVWDSMEKKGFYPSASTYAVMVHGFCKKKGKLEEACKYFEMMIEDGIPPYGSTCEMLRNRIIGLGFSEQVDILADKMERSTSCSIQELSSVLRGNRTNARVKNEERYSSDMESDEEIRYSK